MRRKLRRAAEIGWRSRAFRCRVERLESRSMLAADCGVVVDTLPADVMAGDAVPVEACAGMAVDAMPCDTISWDEWQSCEPVECDAQPWQTVDFASGDCWPDESWPDESWPDESWLMAVDPIDIRSLFVSSATGWASYSYVVSPDGSVADISVVASYDEPTVASFVADHRDEGTVQIEDLGDCWWIDGFPVDLAAPVPEYRVCFFAGCGGGLGTAAAEGDAGSMDAFDVAAEWSWQDVSDAATGDHEVEQAYGMPLWNARGAVLPEHAVTDTVAEEGPSFTADVEAVVAESAEIAATAASHPAAIDPRAAAFADMRMMAAAAAMPQGVAESGTFGGGRRRR